MSKLLFIVTGPSGAGKNTVMIHIRQSFPQVTRVATYTTRAPRPDEIDGIDYRFIREDDFFAKVENGEILEYEQVYNDYFYGSPADIFSDGNIKIMEMDWKGHQTYRDIYKDVRIVSLFLVPPSLEEIRKRILRRSKVDNLESRMINALEQMDHAKDYSYIIINDDRGKMLDEIEAIIKSELIKLARNDNLKFVKELTQQYRQE